MHRPNSETIKNVYVLASDKFRSIVNLNDKTELLQYFSDQSTLYKPSLEIMKMALAA